MASIRIGPSPVCNRNEMTVLAGKNEELQQALDAAKKSLKENARTRRQLDKVLQDAAFAVKSMLAVSIGSFSLYIVGHKTCCFMLDLSNFRVWLADFLTFLSVKTGMNTLQSTEQNVIWYSSFPLTLMSLCIFPFIFKMNLMNFCMWN